MSIVEVHIITLIMFIAAYNTQALHTKRMYSKFQHTMLTPQKIITEALMSFFLSLSKGPGKERQAYLLGDPSESSLSYSILLYYFILYCIAVSEIYLSFIHSILP